MRAVLVEGGRVVEISSGLQRRHLLGEIPDLHTENTGRGSLFSLPYGWGVLAGRGSWGLSFVFLKKSSIT